MAVSQALRRLLRVRELEEEQHLAALESALSEQHRIEIALAAARMRERAGRRQIVRSAAAAPAERISGIVESEAGRRAAAVLARCVAEAEHRAAHLRQLYLARRVERRQAETVLNEAEALTRVEHGRRAQQGLDDWFSQRRHATAAARQPAKNPEMKNDKEVAAIPEEELRTNP